MPKIGTFDVLKVMCERNLDIRLSTLNNISDMRKVKAGTKVTIGVAGDVLNPIWRGELVGGFLLADKKQFEDIKRELEAGGE